MQTAIRDARAGGGRTAELLAEKFSIGVLGLVTEACLVHIGRRVTCVSKDERHIASFLEGRYVPFYEPGLEEHLKLGTFRDRLGFSVDLATVANETDVV